MYFYTVWKRALFCLLGELSALSTQLHLYRSLGTEVIYSNTVVYENNQA